MNKILIILYLLFVSIYSHSQAITECSRELDLAEVDYSAGRLIQITQDIESTPIYKCLQNGNFTREEEIRAKKILTKAYIFADDLTAAEAAFVDLMKTDKEHILSRDDPAELYLFYSKFRTEPVFRVSAKLIGLKSYVNELQAFNTSAVADKRYNTNGFLSGASTALELTVERELFDDFEVAAGIQYRRMSYEVDTNLDTINKSYTITNFNNMLRVPVMIRYIKDYHEENPDGTKLKSVPYVFFGASYDLMLNAKYTSGSREGGTRFTDIEEYASLSDRNQVTKYNVSFFGGVGMKIRMGSSQAKVNFLTFELRYDNSLLNYINPENRNANPDLIARFGHREDDITLNSLSLSVGYTVSIYSIKRKRIK